VARHSRKSRFFAYLRSTQAYNESKGSSGPWLMEVRRVFRRPHNSDGIRLGDGAVDTAHQLPPPRLPMPGRATQTVLSRADDKCLLLCRVVLLARAGGESLTLPGDVPRPQWKLPVLPPRVSGHGRQHRQGPRGTQRRLRENPCRGTATGERRGGPRRGREDSYKLSPFAARRH
jgi:hypothetical protein